MNVRLPHTLPSRLSLAFTALALCTMALPAHADPLNLVNGSFESATVNGGGAVTSSYELGSGVGTASLTGWTSTGYNFVFVPGSATANNGLSLWGPIPTSPDGGNYVGMDGAFSVGPISQTIDGLTVGVETTVSFYYAGGQQSGYDGLTTEGFLVSLGDQTLATPILDDTSHGFTGWQAQTLTFTPDATSEVLSFLAVGTPDGEPPFTLLDGVTVTSNPTPEPDSLILMATGLIGLGGLVRSRVKKNVA